MRILYGVQGTGNGHITRARAMQPVFARKHVQVDYLFSGRDRSALFDMEAFGDFQHREGLTFAVEQGRIKLLQTARQLKARQFLRDVRELDLGGYDLVLTDFEPVTAWAGKRAGIPVIGTGHQYAFHYRVPVAGYNPVSALVMKHFAPVDIALGFHWHHFGQPILPPLFEPPLAAVPSGRIIVYLPFENTAAVCGWLARFPQQDFALFTPKPITSLWPHIAIHPLSHAAFKQELAAGAGVICNTGFELISEALQLGKKILTKPLRGQMEQMSNARALQQLGLAQVMMQMDDAALRAWLTAPPPEPVRYPDVAGVVADWLLAGDWQDPAPLAERLWAASSFAPRLADTARRTFLQPG